MIYRIFKFITVWILLLSAQLISAQHTSEATPRRLAFAWGAEIGGNIDMSGHNMSSVDINAKFGIRWRWIRFLGIGAEGDIMVTNSGRVFPLFVNFRTDFAQSDQLLFMDLRGGLALNYLYDEQDTGGYFSAGIGVTLAKSKTFSSHIILAYSFYGQEKCLNGLTVRKCPGLNEATLRLGIAF